MEMMYHCVGVYIKSDVQLLKILWHTHIYVK